MSTRFYQYNTPELVVDHKHDAPGTYVQPPMHIHNHYELTYLVSGRGNYYIEGTQYPVFAGGLLLIPPITAHVSRLDLSNVYERVIIQFSPELLDELDPTGTIKTFLTASAPALLIPPSSYEVFFKRLYQQIARLKNDPIAYQKSTLLNILSLILFTLRNIQSTSATAPVATGDSISDTIRNILEYINEHLTQEFTLDDLCKQFGISKSYLNKRFKEIYGTTLWNYVLVKRLTLARQQMHNGVPIHEAYRLSGFNDYSSFYRCFVKQFKHSPKEDVAFYTKHI